MATAAVAAIAQGVADYAAGGQRDGTVGFVAAAHVGRAGERNRDRADVLVVVLGEVSSQCPQADAALCSSFALSFFSCARQFLFQLDAANNALAVYIVDF